MEHLKWTTIGFILVAAMFLTGTTVMGQQQLPSVYDPGRIEQRFEEPRKPLSQPDAIIPERVEPLPHADADAIRFFLRSIVIEGVTVFDEKELEPYYTDMLDSEVSLADLERLAERLTVHYRNAGYILARVVVPAQTVDDGVVRLIVVEGYIDQVSIEGDLRGREQLFSRWSERLRASRPLHNRVLERYVLLANDLPGARVVARVRPSKDVPGAADLVLQVEHSYWRAAVGTDNRGTKDSGPWTVNVSGSLNSALGLYERTSLTWVQATDFDELTYLALRQEHVLNSEGTRLTLGTNQIWSEPSGLLGQLGYRTRGETYLLTLSHPLLRSRTRNLSVHGGFVARDSYRNSDFFEANEDRTRVFTLGGTYDWADTLGGVSIVDFALHKGVDALGAHRDAASVAQRSDGVVDFTKLTFSAARTQSLPSNFSLMFMVAAQYAFDSLLASEEFGYGGVQFGRGYDSSAITGDHGLAGLLELRYDWRFENALVQILQPYTFFDAGQTWDRNRADESGSSTGLGVRAYAHGLEADLQMACPLSRVSTERSLDPRVFFMLRYRM